MYDTSDDFLSSPGLNMRHDVENHYVMGRMEFREYSITSEWVDLYVK